VDALFWEENWKRVLDDNIKSKIKNIEDTLNADHVLTRIEIDKLVGDFSDIILKYNENSNLYSIKDQVTNDPITVKFYKDSSFYLRKWISEYHKQIVPKSKHTIDLGTISDSPRIISRSELFD
jgi:hypothetical protein